MELDQFSATVLEEWDPLRDDGSDPGLVIAAQRREIRNILKSYTGSYDLFSELCQNSLDAVERRLKLNPSSIYSPTIWIKIDLKHSAISVTDNGCGMSLDQFQRFMRPNFSFKDGVSTRGNKGVGATYLAYGFNFLEVATKHEGKMYTGVLKNGRQWIEDKSETIARPRVVSSEVTHDAFHAIDSGTSMTIKLVGDHIRPKNFRYNGANNAETWMYVLRVMTPLGGIYLCGEPVPSIQIHLEVVDYDGKSTKAMVEKPEYVYPHKVLGKTADLREYLKDQLQRHNRGLDISKVPARFSKLNSIWGEWTWKEILSNESPLKPQFDSDEKDLLEELELKVYGFLGFSTDLWDEFNDTKLVLRKGLRLLRGGLQLATRNMPQGLPITIPVNRNIYFQNIAHVIVHFNNAEPDLGRKGFQPEHVKLAEKVANSVVTAYSKYYGLLKTKTGVPSLQQQMKLSQWIDIQRDHEVKFPLVIKGRGLFLPTEELPIRSMPQVEQDVVALFNQMLSSGIVRGIQLLSSSQYRQYDGLYRIKLEPPFEKYMLSTENPLGVESSILMGNQEAIESPVRVLEYKYNVDALIEEFQTEEKSSNEIGLVVAWEMGERWKGLFDIVSYLDDNNVHHRQFHGFTHSFQHAALKTHAFEAIILKDLIHYLQDPANESANQQNLYADEIGI